MTLWAEDNDGYTPLMWASGYGHLAVVERLLQEEAVDADAADNDGWTPLMFASSKGHLAVVEALLQAGADRDLQSSTGLTALTFASRYCKGSREQCAGIVALLRSR